ncbi:MAG: hypothetical protein JSR21_04345 [Proteobacteria bacterium]|nr:hypothetical protein [Pseudomonadota bacterium]
MADPVEALLGDMLAWLDAKPRTYAEAIEAWRTSCPRLPVWEEAHDRGFVAHAREGAAAFVRVTPQGRAFAAARR